MKRSDMLFGHEDKIELFKRLVEENKLGHAYLFFGDPQIGKSSFVRHLAYFLEQGEFAVSERPLIDTGFFSPGEKKSIGVETVRAIKNFLSEKPFVSPKRLAVICGCEALTREAESSMLKIAEEPPPQALIVFIASYAETLLPPLLSRLTKIYFSRLAKKNIEEILRLHYKVRAAKAKVVSERSFGRLGRALTLVGIYKDPSADHDLADKIEERIIDVYNKRGYAGSKLLTTLLDREMWIKRFNLNPKLQEKAVAVCLAEDARLWP